MKPVARALLGSTAVRRHFLARNRQELDAGLDPDVVARLAAVERELATAPSPDQLEPLLDRVLVLYESDEEVAEALVLAGRVLEDQKQPDKALAQYREVLEKHPKARYASEAQKRVAELGAR